MINRVFFARNGREIVVLVLTKGKQRRMVS